MLFLLNFISPVKYAFAAMGVAITADLLFGMFSAKKQGKFFLSQSGRDICLFFFYCCVFTAFEYNEFIIKKFCNHIASHCAG